MELVFLVILLALIEYTVFQGLVGRARAKYGVRAPATTGQADFERVNRVHQNTLEALIVFIPAVWIFGLYLSPLWAAGLGVVFIVGRAIYAVGYFRAAEKRGPGAGITGLTNIALVIGALVGVVRALL
ncbi:MAG TPA: MAPEG family protein [Gammaproteobacteria bacterium]|nr:MAPEG family protein [Gammaproteobacteria bacterium]